MKLTYCIEIPQFLYDAGLSKSRKQMIGITQPRRVAAISLAKRVATEMGFPDPDQEVRKPGQNDKTSLPAVVSYSVRFDDRSSRDTRIKFMTDGWLLRELLVDDSKGKRRKRRFSGLPDSDQTHETLGHSLLEQYSVIIIDEAHERSVHTDVVIGLVKRVQKERKRRRQAWLLLKAEGKLPADQNTMEPTDLKVVIMSATIDADKFARFFSSSDGHPAPILYVKGRQYPIRLFHADQACTDWADSCKKLIVQLSSQPPGDVLIFMTGAEEIETLAAELNELNKGLKLYAEGLGKEPPMDLIIVKLYAALGGEAIRKCFATTPPNARKIVLATNIAETSITISGIKYVIDCGLAKERTFQRGLMDNEGPTTSGASLEMLTVKPISKAAARQRAGRAGRESGGSCFRLFTEDTFESLDDSTLPEILRTDLSSVVLNVFAMDLNPLEFDWLDRPDDEGLKAAVINLTELGALELATQDTLDHGNKFLQLTSLGRQMAKLPLLPSLAKTLLFARDLKDEGEATQTIFAQALDIVSILSTERRSILLEPIVRNDDSGGSRKREEADRARGQFAHPTGDHATQLQALNAFLQVQESCRQPSNKETKRAFDAARLKDWCNTHYVSLKAVREALRIRKQLLQVCRKQGWGPSGFISDEDATANEPISADESDSDDPMLVTKGSQVTTPNEPSDYSALRKCLMQGKRLNTALREGRSSNYQPVHGGTTRFRIHPSSTLVSQQNLPMVIYFEDIVFTSQLFARTVSGAEASWLADTNATMRSRASLQ